MASREQHLLGKHRDDRDQSVRRAESDATVELREEELQARTQLVDVGEVSIGTEIVEEQRTVTVPVTHEAVTVERHPVDRRPSDEPIGAADDVIEVPVHREEAIADKRTVVYEEVDVAKRVIHDEQPVSATVRKEVLDVDAVGDVELNGRSPLDRRDG